MFCDIVLLPEQGLSQKAIDLSHQLHQLGGLFELSGQSPVPHISLYFGVVLSPDNLERAKGFLEQVASRTPPLALMADSYFQSEGYIDANYPRTSAIVELQEALLDAINPLRDGLRPQDIARLEVADKQTRANIEQYGYRNVGDLFRPHLTFTRFSQYRPVATHTLPDPRYWSGDFPRLGLFELGSHGTCVRQLAVFDLAGPVE